MGEVGVPLDMAHTQNIAEFLSVASKCTNELVGIYCALVAIELVLKQHIAISDHNVPGGIDRIRLKMAVGHKSGCGQQLTSLAAKLRNDLATIAVQSKQLTPRFAPAECYPYIRYARMSGDGWGAPETSPEQLKILGETVSQVRFYLKVKFGMPL